MAVFTSLNALAVLASAGVDFDFVALGHENWHTHFEAGSNLGRLQDLARGITFDGGLGLRDLAHHAGGLFNREGMAVIKHHFEIHAV